MKPKNTWLLLALAAGLFAFIYLFERHIQPPAPVVRRLAPGLNVDEVSSVQIFLKDQNEVRIERTNGAWRMTKPVVDPVQVLAVEKFLHALAELSPRYHRSAQELLGHKNVIDEFGFDAPYASIFVQQGDDSFRLSLGKFTAPGDEIYAQKVGSGDVDTISTDFIKLLPADADAWRDRTFVRMDDAVFDRLIVKHGDRLLEFQRDGTNKPWSMTRPTPSPADNSRIGYLLNQVRKALVTRFVHEDSRTDLAAAGLQPAQLELTLAQGTNTVLALQFGNTTTNDDSELYARAGAQRPVVLVARGQLEHWGDGANDFRDRNLVSLGEKWESLARGFTIQVTGPEARPDYTVWCGTNGAVFVTDTNKANYPVDPNALRAFFTNLGTLQVAIPYSSNAQLFAVKDIVPEEQLGEYGLAATNLVRRFLLSATPPGETPTVLAELDFGLPNPGAKGTLFVRRAHILYDHSVYAVSNVDFARLPASALDLRQRRIWSFDAADVSRFAVSLDGNTRTLDHRGPSAWPPANVPGSVSISDPNKEMTTEVLVGNLGMLEAESWVRHADKDQPEYGFTDKSLRLSVELKNGEKARLDFGGPAPGGGRYAAVTQDGQKWVFVYAKKDWDSLLEWIWLPEH